MKKAMDRVDALLEQSVIQALQIKNKNGSVNRIEKFSLILFERAVLIIESLNKKVGAVPIDFDDDYEEPHYEKI